MKILAAADIHGDKTTIDKLIDKAKKEEVDAVVLCGDLTLFESSIDNIIGPFKELGKKIFIIPGNHETPATIEFWVKKYGPGVYDLHGKAVLLYNDIALFGVGSANIGLFNVGESEIERLLDKTHEHVKNAKHKIMVTHVPPKGTKLDKLWAHVGSEGVRKAIEKIQPDLCICGHIHETAGKMDKIGKTKVINVGKEGVVIDIPK